MGGEILGIFIPVALWLLLWNFARLFFSKKRPKAGAMLGCFFLIIAIEFYSGSNRWVTWSLIIYPVLYLLISPVYSLLGWLITKLKERGSDKSRST